MDMNGSMPLIFLYNTIVNTIEFKTPTQLSINSRYMSTGSSFIFIGKTKMTALFAYFRVSSYVNIQRSYINYTWIMRFCYSLSHQDERDFRESLDTGRILSSLITVKIKNRLG